MERQCEWIGTVGNIEEHKAECEFALVLCPKHCTGLVLRKEMKEHLEESCPYRNYQCQHCKKEGPFMRISGEHDKVCHQKVIRCTNAECEESVKRREMKRHLEQCPFTEKYHANILVLDVM